MDNPVERLHRLKNRQTAAITAVTKKRNELSQIMTSADMLHLVKSNLDEFNQLWTDYEKHYTAHTDEIMLSENTDKDDKLDRESQRYDDKQNSMLDFRTNVMHWITQAENALSDEVGTRSTKSSSSSKRSRNTGSSRSTSSTVRSREKANIASLLAEKSMLQRKQQLEAQQLQLNAQQEECRIDTELKKAQAREQVFANEQSDSIMIDIMHDNHNVNPLHIPVSINTPSTLQDNSILGNQSVIHNTQHYAMSTNVTTQATSFTTTVSSSTVPIMRQQPATSAHLHPNVTAINHELPYVLPSSTVIQSVPLYSVSHTTNPYITPFLPHISQLRSSATPEHQTYNQMSQTQELLSAQNQLANAMTLPQPEVPKFTGDPIEYITFTMAFDARIASRINKNSDMLYYLDQHLQGEPKELIGGCLYMDPDRGYPEARQLLHREYGEPYKVSTAYVSKVLSWPTIKHDDSVGLRKLCFFLIKCNNAMSNMSHMTVLNHSPNMQSIVHKLPSYLQNKWRDHVTKLRKRSHGEATFSDLVSFIEMATEAANDPIYGKQALGMSDHISRPRTDERYPITKHRSSSFVTNVNSTETCLFCSNTHDLDDCKDFCSQSIETKRSFLMSKRLCFSCYGTNHVSNGCLQKRTCVQCGKRHPSAMHDSKFVPIYSGSNHRSAETQSQVSSSSCLAIDTMNTTVMHAILPVIVTQKGSDQQVCTYAFYDNGSSGCFMAKELQEELEATGTDTLLQLRTMHGQTYVNTTAIEDLVVSDLRGNNAIHLPKTYTRDEIPVNSQQIPRPETFKQWPQFRSIAKQLHSFMPWLSIGLLIGNNCPAALEPLNVIPTSGMGPYACLLRHGWTVNGPLQVNSSLATDIIISNRIIVQDVEHVKEALIPTDILKMMELDFSEWKPATLPDEKGYSPEDRKFLQIVQDNIRLCKGHYEVPLPFRDNNVKMPYNRTQALSRANWQRKKMLHNEAYRKDYTTFIDNILLNGYAQKVPSIELSGTPGQVWYLPHHGVYHPKKPNKIRVVFDASAKFNGKSLNDELLQGPDLTNSLFGVLTRFREENIAFMGDIEAMFHQVTIPTAQHDFLRFLWWSENDFSREPEDFRMTVHLFGAVSSPSVANFVLKHVASNSEGSHGSLATSTILNNFYVDDCLRSVSDEQTAIDLIQDVTSACDEGGFRLTKFISNSSKVLLSVPKAERSKEVQSYDLDYDDLPIERALGIQWCVETDCFGFSIMIKAKPPTRRGILSTISSIYDPLGFIAPFLLMAKRILQNLCRESNLGWDEEVPVQYKYQWQAWLSELPYLEDIAIQRCLKPKGLGQIVSKQIHVFADASTQGYGAVAYLRCQDINNNADCAFVMGKSRLAPIKLTTVPRLELTAATVAVRIAKQLQHELSMDSSDITFHTDSTTVLHYIRNEKKRFPIFVANRVRLIRDFSEQQQWRYVNTDDNPADDASRGLSGKQITSNKRWFMGPDFLAKPAEQWPEQPEVFNDLGATDELSANATLVDESVSTMNTLIDHFSDWQRLQRAVAVFHRVRKILHERRSHRMTNMSNQESRINGPINVQDIMEAETSILKFVQYQRFSSEINSIKASGQRGRVSKQSLVYRLDPYLAEGLLRVGGRIRKSDLPDSMKHPILLSHKCHVAQLIIRYIHTQLGHAGRNHVLSKIRERYWITHSNAAVRHVIASCVMCRRQREPTNHQKMADLPASRMSPAPAFSYCGVDYFGPYIVKEGRKNLKRYGVLFTCLSSRAVHIETANTLDTDSFINALRRFIARRGPVREMRSDNGTNFIGAERELFRAIDQDHIRRQMLKNNIDWKFNPPAASHMGGVWERLIRTVRKVLSQLLSEFSDRLDDESLRTLLCEVEAIINSRPLTFVSNDADDLDPLTPNHLLTMKTSVIMPPPGEFQRNDVYLRKRWRRVQFLVNMFWTRWKREYLSTLQTRQKWNHPKRNLQTGDIVLVKDENTHRNNWALGRILSTEPDDQGFVRSVKLKTQTSELRRPVTKLVLLLAVEEQLSADDN